LKRLMKITGFVCMVLFLWHAASCTYARAGETISIEVHHSYLLQTEKPIIRASVADPKIADVTMLTPTQILVVSKAKVSGSTSLIIWYDEKTIIAYDIIVYTTIRPWIVTAIKDRISTIAPKIKIDIIGAGVAPEEETILLKGSVASQEVLNQILTIVESFNIKYYNLIRLTGSQQVQLKVVIAEISKSGLKQMGLNFSRMSQNLGIGLFKGQPKGTDTTQENASTVLVTASDNLSTPFGNAFQIALTATKYNWLAMISLLKGQGLARSLATPTLVTMNGQEAEFQVGGSFPVPVQGDSGSISIQNIPYGVILKFTPYIIDREVITLKVSPEVSYPDFSLGVTAGGATVPGLATRKADTTLQLKSGQTFAMAGLLKENFYQTVNKIPFLGDIPFIGTAFTSKETNHSETELLIMVTPTIVRAMEEEKVPGLPGKEIKTKISDIDFFIKNKFEGSEESDEKQAVFKGKTGFIK